MPYPVAAAQGGMLRLSGGGGLTFLLRDDFTTAAGAPLTSPRSSEPGPGTLTITDTNSKLSIAGGKLDFATGGSTSDRVSGAALARATGLAVVGKANLAAANGLEIGWDNDLLTAPLDSMRFANNLDFRSGGTAIAETTFSLATDYSVAVILRTSGSLFFVKGGAFTDWTLYFVGFGTTTTPLYPTISVLSATTIASVDNLRALQLPAPFDSDYGLATQRLAGAQSAGQTFTHEANCVIEFTVGGSWVWGAGFDQVQVTFRRQDASNYWELSGDNYGTARLKEYVGGTPTTRGTAGTSSVPFRVVVVAEGSTIRVYSKNVLLFTYSSASNFATETDGSVANIGAAGSVSDLIAWPRTLTGAAAALLDGAIA